MNFNFKSLTNDRPIHLDDGERLNRQICNYFQEEYAIKIMDKLNKLSNGLLKYRGNMYFINSIKLDYEYFRINHLSKIHKNNRKYYSFNHRIFNDRKNKFQDKILFNIEFELFDIKNNKKDKYIIDLERFLKDKEEIKYICSIDYIDELCKLNNIELNQDMAYCYNLFKHLSRHQDGRNTISIDVNQRKAPCLIINNELYIGDNDDDDLNTHSRLLIWISNNQDLELENEYDYSRNPDDMEEEEGIESFAFGHLIYDENNNNVIVWEIDTMTMEEEDYLRVLDRNKNYIHVCSDEAYDISTLFMYNNRENMVYCGNNINNKRCLNLSMYGVRELFRIEKLRYFGDSEIIDYLTRNKIIKKNKKIYSKKLLYKRKKELRY